MNTAHNVELSKKAHCRPGRVIAANQLTIAAGIKRGTFGAVR